MSRVLREYYERKNAPLPNWLFDSRTPAAKKSPVTSRQGYSHEYLNEDTHAPLAEQRRSHGRKQKLWETSSPEQPPPAPSSRERDREREDMYRHEQRLSDRPHVYEPSPRPPPSPSRSKYSGYEADDDYGASSRRRGGSFLNEPAQPPARSRSPSRGYRDFNDEYYSPPRYNHPHHPPPPSPRGDRFRGPTREMQSRYPERAGEYF